MEMTGRGADYPKNDTLWYTPFISMWVNTFYAHNPFIYLLLDATTLHVF